MFKINNENFDIEQAYIDALLDDEESKRLIIGLEIEGKRVNDITLPAITSDTLLRIKKNEITKWQDIAGKTVEWGKYSKNIWKPHMKFINCYKNTYRGNFIYNAKIEFMNIDNKIYVKLKGLCDSKWNVEKIQTLSLDIETEIEFTWIQMGLHETEESARNKLKPYIDVEDFEYKVEPLELNNGSIVDMGKFTLKK